MLHPFPTSLKAIGRLHYDQLDVKLELLPIASRNDFLNFCASGLINSNSISIIIKTAKVVAHNVMLPYDGSLKLRRNYICQV